MHKITRRSELVAGILYCLFTYELDVSGSQEYSRDGALLYWTGEKFMDEHGEARYDDWDYVVACTAVPNLDYVAGVLA